MGNLRGAIVDALSVVINGVHIIGAHLPVLLAVYLAGAAVHDATIWGAVELSKQHSTLAGYLLPIAPLATLAAFILMLRAVSPSLRHASFNPAGDTATAPRARVGKNLTLLASALVPFLTVYAAQGYLKEDTASFVNAAVYDELFGNANAFYGVSANTDRAIIASGTLLVGMVIVALVLRFLINRLELPSKHFAWGLLAAYVEVFWLFLLAKQFVRYKDIGWSWVEERTFVAWVSDRWATFTDALGPAGEPVAAVVRFAGSLINDANAVVVIPIAWLTVGAVALGQQITPPDARSKDRPWRRRLDRVPSRVRRWGGEATADIRGRFQGLGNGIRLLAIGGLVPMMLFCIVFVIARQSANLAAEGIRVIVGPQLRDTALAFSPYVAVASEAVYTLLLVGLLAAAIDRIILHRDERDAAAEAAEPVNAA